MFNNTGVTQTKYNDTTQILIDPSNYFAMGIVVDDTCGVVDSTTGRKIAKAGTPVTGNLDARGTAFTPAVTTTVISNAVGVLLHDVDLTQGDNNGAILLFGFVNTNRIDATTKAKITNEVKTALNKITFVAC
jgi:hypothetical protein